MESNRNGSRFADATLNGHVIGGILNVGRSAIPGRQPNWLSFISTSDVDRLARETEARGGKIVRMPRNTPGRGRDAILRDPHGAVFAVLKGNTEDPPDELVEVGDWIWSSLLTTDPDHDAGFYQSLFDYDVFETPDSNEKSQHLLLSADDYARASVNSLPAANKKARPHWLNYVRVNSADTTIAQAISLGGKVLVSPRVDRHGDKVGVIADPAGAPFGLLEWRPDTEIETVR